MSEHGSSPRWDDGYLAALADLAVSLTRFIDRRVRGDAHAVEDLTQDTLLQLGLYVRHRALPRGDMKRLAYKIANDRVVDWYRRSGKAHLFPSDDILILEAATHVSASLAEDVVAHVDLERALSRLTPQQRRTLVLFYLEGLQKRHSANNRRGSQGSPRTTGA